MTPATSHEWRHRARRVALLVAFVPLGETRAANEAAAAHLAAMPQGQRNDFAAAALSEADLRGGPPSETTWALVVEVVRQRALPLETMGDAHARGLGVLRVLNGGLDAGGGR